jgi:hypothetical protein
VTGIKIRRFKWQGHVIRMGDTRIPKIIFNTKPEGRRGVRRHKLRWLDDVEADIKTVGIKNGDLNFKTEKNGR